MADSSAAPATHVTVARPLAILHALLLLALIVVGGMLAVQHFLHHDPVPPAPAPVPPDPKPPVPPPPTPDPKPPTPPAPVDMPPHAAISGLFLSIAPAPTGVGNPSAPLGMFRLDATASLSARPIRWKVAGPHLSLMVFDPSGKPAGSIAEAVVTEPGTYRFMAVAIGTVGGQPDADIAAWQYTVPDPRPPDPPPGPTPPPPPTPDPPKPPDPPAPIPGDGLRVLFLYESADLSKYPKDQLAVFYDQGFRDYLSSVCAKVGQTPEYRVWDKDIDVSNESETWKKAMGRGFKELPWMIVSNGKTGYEGKVPANLAETKALIAKYAEVKP